MADIATLVFDIESGPARTAATDLAKLNQAAVKASSGADKLNKTLRDSSGRFISSAKVVEQYGGEVRQLANKYNPALAAVYKYQQTQVELNRAVSLGVLSQQQADAALAAYVTNANSAAVAADRLASAQRNTGAYTANVFAQLNDIGVMMAAGQNPIQLALQQGTQLNQVWASMGKEGKSLAGVAGVLKGAIFSMVSPMSLLTLGTIAGAAALTQWAFSSDDADKASKNLNEKTDSLADSINNYAKAAKLARQSAAGLTDEYGAQFAAAASVLGINAELAKNQIFRDLAVSAESMSNQFQDLVGYVTQYDYMIRRGVDGADVAARQARLLKEEFGLTVDEARGLSNILSDILAASTPEKMAEAMSRFASEVANAAKGNVEVSQSLRDAAVSANGVADAVLKATGATGKAISATNQWASAMWGVRNAVAGILSGLNAISGQAIGFAAAEAELKALRAGKKVAEARHIGEVQRIKSEGALRTAELTRELGVRGKIQGVLEQAANLALLSKQQELAVEQELARQREKESNKGGGGALTKAQNQFQSLRELLEQETLFEFAEFEKRQAQLDNALSKRLLSEQNYQILKDQLQTYYFGSEYEKAALNYQLKQEQLDLALSQDLISRQRHAEEIQALEAAQRNASLQGYATLFGNMASIAKAGGDKATGVVKAFSIAQGLLNSYLAFTQVLADPSLIGRPFLRTALAYSTLGAGLAQVAAMRGSGGSSAASSVSSAASAAASQQQIVEYKIYGDSFGADLVEDILTQIQRQQKDGNNLIIRRA